MFKYFLLIYIGKEPTSYSFVYLFSTFDARQEGSQRVHSYKRDILQMINRFYDPAAQFVVPYFFISPVFTFIWQFLSLFSMYSGAISIKKILIFKKNQRKQLKNINDNKKIK